MNILKRLDQAALDILFPSGLTCMCCGEVTYGDNLCMECVDQLMAIRMQGEQCPDCGDELNEDKHCERCETYGRLWARSVWKHTGPARTLVHQLKFNAVQEAREPLCDGMAETARRMDLPADTVVTWVSMPEKRLKERGIDHACLLAEGIAVRLGYPCQRLLQRVETDKLHTQQGLSGEERSQNLKGTFQCTVPLAGTVLLVDDVLTTGTTARECQDILLAAGAERVAIISATRGGQKD